MLSPNSKLDHYFSLASSATGLAAADLVLRATADPHLHVFSELLSLPTISALASNPSTAPHHALLILFAFSTYSTYIENTALYPALTPAHIQKLRTLSLVTLAAGRSSIPYDDLVSALGLASHRDLEVFVLEAGYSGLLSARLDQRAARVLVSGAAARDVDLRDGAGDVAAITATLAGWKENSAKLLAVIDEQIAFVTSEKARNDEVVKTNEAAQKRVQDSAGLLSSRRGLGARGMMGGMLSGGFEGGDLFEHIETDSRGGGRRFDRRMGSRSTRSKFQP